MQPDAHLLHLAVRWLHVAAMATAFGGAVAVFTLARTQSRDSGDAVLLDLAIRYEFLFWAAAGILAMTGIGNLAVFGPGLPVSRTDWGGTFMFKLVAVLTLVFLSLPRTLCVARLSSPVAGAEPNLRGTLRLLYGLSAALFAVILGIAVWLAHG